VTSKLNERFGTAIADAERAQTKLSAHCYADLRVQTGTDKWRWSCASGYITKPYLEEALLDAAQRMLR